jgi:hypothetical protein
MATSNPRVRAECKRILDRAARRVLRERLDAEKAKPEDVEHRSAPSGIRAKDEAGGEKG